MIKTNKITFSYTEYDNFEDLSHDDQELIIEARDAASKAYAPYSKFMVGSAVRLTSGIIIKGSNVENAAFPSGICAERNALSNSITNYPDDNPVAMVVCAVTENGLNEEPPSPCGNCRQVISEEESRINGKIKIILSGKNKTLIIDSINSLLPLRFNRDSLKF